MTRLWIDANVLLRFLTGEPKDLAGKAARLMARAERGEVVLVLSSLVVAEVFWVLRSFYQHSLEDIADVLVPLMSADGVGFTRKRASSAWLRMFPVVTSSSFQGCRRAASRRNPNPL